MMIFISMIKFKKKANEVVAAGKEIMTNLPSGVKMIGTYWTLGKFDAVSRYQINPANFSFISLSKIFSKKWSFFIGFLAVLSGASLSQNSIKSGCGFFCGL